MQLSCVVYGQSQQFAVSKIKDNQENLQEYILYTLPKISRNFPAIHYYIKTHCKCFVHSIIRCCQ